MVVYIPSYDIFWDERESSCGQQGNDWELGPTGESLYRQESAG